MCSFFCSVVDPKRYQKVTSYCRSIQLLGYMVGAVLGQLLVSFDLMSFNDITVFTLVLTSIALFTSLFLPMPQHSMFFHRKHATQRADGPEDVAAGAGGSAAPQGGEEDGKEGNGEKGEDIGGERQDGGEVEESAGAQSCSRVLLQLFRDFRQCYSSRQLFYWSLWWAMATCGYNQTVNYVQVSCHGNTMF